MIVVIQCAALKQDHAGSLPDAHGNSVKFVAHPRLIDIRNSPGLIYKHPDDLSDQGVSWRTVLTAYNDNPQDNPSGLLKARDLYKPEIYRKLSQAYGLNNTFILSAGWGLVRSDFLLPNYDITFNRSNKIEPSRIRQDTSGYNDYYQISPDMRDPLLFIGTNGYLPLFDQLTDRYPGPRLSFYRTEPGRPGNPPHEYKNIEWQPFETTRRTNWHYSCAEQLIDGTIAP